ncbi:MAG: hypothetical protein ACI9VM_000471 [Candidatus Azotimanducaceae bacterium]|jgi:hypothetical protein
MSNLHGVLLKEGDLVFNFAACLGYLHLHVRQDSDDQAVCSEFSHRVNRFCIDVGTQKGEVVLLDEHNLRFVMFLLRRKTVRSGDHYGNYGLFSVNDEDRADAYEYFSEEIMANLDAHPDLARFMADGASFAVWWG